MFSVFGMLRVNGLNREVAGGSFEGGCRFGLGRLRDFLVKGVAVFWIRRLLQNYVGLLLGSGSIKSTRYDFLRGLPSPVQSRH